MSVKSGDDGQRFTAEEYKELKIEIKEVLKRQTNINNN